MQTLLILRTNTSLQTPTHPDAQIKMWIPALELTNTDKQILLNPVGWLTDTIIDAAQMLLKEISPVPGLEPVAKWTDVDLQYSA